MNNGPAGALPAPESAAHEFQTVIDPFLIRRYGQPGSRYLSYPSLDRFVEATDAKTCDHWIAYRRIGGPARPLGVYAHVVGFGTGDSGAASACAPGVSAFETGPYVACLGREIALLAARLGADRAISRLRVGGRRATLISAQDCGALMEHLRADFDLHHDLEQTAELDSCRIETETLAMFAAAGFNRLSLRVPPSEPGSADSHCAVDFAAPTIIAAARAHGFRSVSVDLVYGSPGQSAAEFEAMLAGILSVGVERVALHSWHDRPLHGAAARMARDDMGADAWEIELLVLALRMLGEAGYGCAAMDQYARSRPAAAQGTGRLSDDMHDYLAGAAGDLLGIGAAAVGKIGPLYYQNMIRPDDYARMLDHGRLPILRGIELTMDDLVRRAVMQALACLFMVSKEAIALAHLIDFDRYFADELRELEELAGNGIVSLEGDWIQVTPCGRPVVRAVCAVFDRYRRVAAARSAPAAAH